MGSNCSTCKSREARSKKQSADIITSNIEPNENCQIQNHSNFRKSKRSDKVNKYIEKEEKLAHRLKKICDKHGEEYDYFKSALILHKLGLLYQKRSSDMFSLIKCAALFNAAIARSPDHTQERIENDLKQLCFLILDKGNAKNKDADLIHHSKEVKKSIHEMRLKVSKALNSPKFKQINSLKFLNEKQLKELELSKISAVRSLQNELTCDYKNIMATIAHFGEEVMGKAPCKYAVVGMGSLARKEITPYSDFEHMIVLENFDESCAKTEAILNYFRWFSVIFHVIIINLQETILPAVSIFSLNDELSKLGNWYYDGFTTRGISFDGMMPHASKFPLGRQQFTETKPWKTELIKPVCKMVMYLRSDESLKNGYHLSDILTKTCFVYGDANVYNEFEVLVQEVLQKQEETLVLNEVKNQILDDLLRFSMRATLLNISSKNQIDIKKDIYRSTTLFICALGRIYKIFSSSCFDIINELAKQKKISHFAWQKLSYAIALACEFRLTWYMKNKSQCDVIESENPVNDLVAMVGKASTISYFQIAYALQCEVSKRFNLKKFHFYSDPKLLNLNIHYCFNVLSSFSKRLKKCRPNIEDLAQRFTNFDECLMVLEKDEKDGQLSEEKAMGNDTSGNYDWKQYHMRHFRRLGDIFKFRECFDDAVEFYTKAITLCSEKALLDKTVIEMQMNSKRRNIQTGKPYVSAAIPFARRYKESSAVTFDNVIEELADIHFRRAKCLIKLGKLHEAMVSLKKSLELYELVSIDVETDIYVALTLHEIACCFRWRKEFAEAMRYLKKSLLIKERISIDSDTDQCVGITLHSMGCCLNEMNNLTEAKYYLRKSLEIDKRVTHDSSIDNNIALSLLDLGHCLVEMNSLGEAKTCLENSLEIRLKIIRDSLSDIKLADCYYELGHCMVAMKKLFEAKDYLEMSLQIYKNASLDIDCDYHIADCSYELGVCFFSMKKTLLALEYLEKSLNIRKSVSFDGSIDCDVADSLQKIAQCYVELKRYATAKDYFKESLIIYKQVSHDIDTSKNMETILRFINTYDRCNRQKI